MVNMEIPSHGKDYIHRVGRTARAGRAGRSIAFVTQVCLFFDFFCFLIFHHIARPGAVGLVTATEIEQCGLHPKI